MSIPSSLSRERVVYQNWDNPTHPRRNLIYNRNINPDNLFLYLFCFLLACRLGTSTGSYYIDSAKLAVCHNQRTHSHKVFKGLVKRGKTSTG